MVIGREKNDMARTVPILIVALLLALCSALGAQVHGLRPTANPEYSGSEMCAECHEREYTYWKITPHASMARVPDWTGSKLLKQLSSDGLPFPIENVDLVIGNLKVLVFLTQSGPDLVALPKQYNIGLARWEDFTEDEWEPRQGEAGVRTAAEPVSWNARCAGCHTTGYNTVTASFVELSVGCEECHGPGATHCRTEKKDDIVNPKSLSPAQAASVCGQCHSRGVSKDAAHPFPDTFLPGDALADHFDVLRPQLGTNTKAFWGNGMASRHHQQYQEFAQSVHSAKGMSCIDCHEGHRFRLDSAPQGPKHLWARTEVALLAHRSHSVCLRCHTAGESEFKEVIRPAEGLDAPQIQSVELHSHHPLVLEKRVKVGGVGAKSKLLCNDCHMPMTAPAEFGYPMHTHTFRAPNPRATQIFGVPNACNHCHSDKSPAWAREQYLAQWVLAESVSVDLIKLMAEFEDVGPEYLQLRTFLSDAGPSGGSRLKLADSLHARIHDFVMPIRERAIGAEQPDRVDEVAFENVRDELGDVESMLTELSRHINNQDTETRAELRALLDRNALAALNCVLRVKQLPEESTPPAAASYGKTAEAFRAFNRAVDMRGRSFFEDEGRHTRWSTWVEIYAAMARGAYRENPDHNIAELEQMGLIKKRLSLE